MIIDVHNHIVAGGELGAYQAGLIASAGFHGKGSPGITEESIKKARWRGHSHADVLKEVGTDWAFISPRPYTMMHSMKPEKIVRWYCEAVNDTIALQVKLEPDRFRGIGGLPQCAGVSPKNVLDELDRCVNDLGFVGVMINPDPGEGDGQTPGMGDEYWYPLYEKLVQLDLPALVHAASCRNQRESFHNHFITEEGIAIISLLSSKVFDDFPKLKLIISHGGGPVPYQVGRWRSQLRGPNDTENFDERLKNLYFDTALYSVESLELLFKIVGPDRCLFGTERPGAGSKKNPRTGRWYDDVRPMIESLSWLSVGQKEKIFQQNAESVFSRFKAK
ncbi:MAG TPA: amidohydrolase family protein [Candidatus Binatia bacterium]|jgi:4-oxalmesaconate hydratase